MSMRNSWAVCPKYRFLDPQPVWLSLWYTELKNLHFFKQTPREVLSTLWLYSHGLKDIPGISLSKCNAHSLCSLWETQTWWCHFHQWALAPQGWSQDCQLLWAENFPALQTQRKRRASFSEGQAAPSWWRVPSKPGLDDGTTACLPAKSLKGEIG